MTVHDILSEYGDWPPSDAFRYWLMSSNIGNPNQRTRLAQRMAKAYKQNSEYWDTQLVQSLFDEAQW